MPSANRMVTNALVAPMAPNGPRQGGQGRNTSTGLSPNGYGFFRTPKDINLRIWVSLEELAEICKKVPVDPSKNITKKQHGNILQIHQKIKHG